MILAARRPRAATIVRRDFAARWLTVIAWTAIVVGITLRFTQLPTRVLYLDEAFTQMRVAGHTSDQMNRALNDGHSVRASDVERYAIVDASASPARLVASLESEDAQHPPLFYLIEFAAVKILGNALVAWRVVPVLFGLLSIWAAAALARQLFGTSTAGLLAAAVFAVSPIERIYSDQAREYSLFVCLLLVATLSVVRAVRRSDIRNWTVYSLLLIAGLYANPFMLYVMAAHAVFIASSVHSTRKPFGFIMAAIAADAVALAAYSPWLYQMFIHRNDIAQTNVWSAAHWPLLRLAAKWAFNAGATYFDLEYLDLRWSVLLVVVAGVAGVAAVRGFLAADVAARWCLGAAIAVPAVLLMAPDLLLGQHRSSVARYGLPVSAMLAILSARGLVGRPIAATVVLAAGALACLVGAQHTSWWDNDSNADDAAISAVVSHTAHAQVISSLPPIAFVGFARELPSATPVSLSSDLRSAQFSAHAPLFVLRPSERELRALEARSGLQFTPVSFAKTRTAHDIGTTIAGNERSATMSELYTAVESTTTISAGQAGSGNRHIVNGAK